jgi:hypothetical protein
VAILVTVVVLLVALSVWLWRKNASVAEDVLEGLVDMRLRQELHEEMQPQDERSSSARLVSKAKIMISYLQVSAAFLGMFKGVAWPDIYARALGPLQLFDLNPLRLAVPGCIRSSWGMDAYGDFQVAIALPALTLVVVGLRWASLSHSNTATLRHRAALIRNGLFFLLLLHPLVSSNTYCTFWMLLLTPDCVLSPRPRPTSHVSLSLAERFAT